MKNLEEKKNMEKKQADIFLDAMGEIDYKYVKEAEETRAVHRNFIQKHRYEFTAVAAALVLVLGGITWHMQVNESQLATSTAADSATMIEDGNAFDMEEDSAGIEESIEESIEEVAEEGNGESAGESGGEVAGEGKGETAGESNVESAEENGGEVAGEGNGETAGENMAGSAEVDQVYDDGLDWKIQVNEVEKFIVISENAQDSGEIKTINYRELLNYYGIAFASDNLPKDMKQLDENTEYRIVQDQNQNVISDQNQVLFANETQNRQMAVTLSKTGKLSAPAMYGASALDDFEVVILHMEQENQDCYQLFFHVEDTSVVIETQNIALDELLEMLEKN